MSGDLRAAAVQLRAAAVKAGAHIVVTTDYPDGVKAFGILCDAIDVMDRALEDIPEGAVLVTEETLAAAINDITMPDPSEISRVWTVGWGREWYGAPSDLAAAILRHLREGT